MAQLRSNELSCGYTTKLHKYRLVYPLGVARAVRGQRYVALHERPCFARLAPSFSSLLFSYHLLFIYIYLYIHHVDSSSRCSDVDFGFVVAYHVHPFVLPVCHVPGQGEFGVE